MKSSLKCSVSALALLGATSLASPSFAQGISPFDWSGGYVGAVAGGGSAIFSGTFQGNSGTCGGSSCVDFADLNLTGSLAGVYGGYNWQIPSSLGAGKDLVFGIEADATATDVSGTILARRTSDGGASAAVDLLGSVRARAGVAFDKTLVYGTAGIATGNAAGTTFETPESSQFDRFAFSKLGGVVGAGVEYAISDKFSVRLEGLYYVFDDSVDISGNGSGRTGDVATFNSAFSVRIGAAYAF